MWGCILNFSASYFHCRITEKALFLQNKVVCLQREVTKADSSSSTLPLETERLSIAAETQWAHFLATFFKQQKTKQFCTISFFFLPECKRINLNWTCKWQNKKLRLLSMSIIFLQLWGGIRLNNLRTSRFQDLDFIHYSLRSLSVQQT